MENIEQEVIDLPTQVGGHRPSAEKKQKGVLQYHDRVLKPLEQGNRAIKELRFYETIFASLDETLKGIHDLVPQFFGTINFVHQGQMTKLENICYHFDKPTVLDLKMGTQTYGEDASKEKIELEINKYPPQKDLGFRFTGMKVHQMTTQDYKDYDRFYGRGLTPENAIEGFKNYFDNGEEIRKDTIPLFISKLKEILDWFNSQRHYRFYSSSLLFVYEGNKEKPPKIELRMIDFAHATLVKDERADEGYILGLKNTISMLQNIFETEIKK